MTRKERRAEMRRNLLAPLGGTVLRPLGLTLEEVARVTEGVTQVWFQRLQKRSPKAAGLLKSRQLRDCSRVEFRNGSCVTVQRTKTGNYRFFSYSTVNGKCYEESINGCPIANEPLPVMSPDGAYWFVRNYCCC